MDNDLEVRLFYDLLCPASKASHYNVKEFLAKSPAGSKKTYAELMSVKITPIVLPYHLHSF